MGGPSFVERAFQRGCDDAIRRRVWPRHPRRRHGTGAELDDHLLEHFRIGGGFAQIECVQCESGGALLLIVAGDAVFIEERSGIGSGSGRLGLHQDRDS